MCNFQPEELCYFLISILKTLLFLDVVNDGLAKDGSVADNSAEDEHDTGKHPASSTRHSLR